MKISQISAGVRKRPTGQIVIAINKLMAKVEAYTSIKMAASEYYIDYDKLRRALRSKGEYNTSTIWITRTKLKRRFIEK